MEVEQQNSETPDKMESESDTIDQDPNGEMEAVDGEMEVKVNPEDLVLDESANLKEEEGSHSECLDDPNFAIICSFLDKFGEHFHIGDWAYDELQAMIETNEFVAEPLLKLHLLLLRRVYKNCSVDRWERTLARFAHSYFNQDGWEIERFGYKNAKLQTKLRILKNLLEAQFDYNVKFKAEVNKREASDLRMIPIGRDREGQLYWYQVDNDANLRVYREDVDDETWEVVACTREGLVDLISKLRDGDIKPVTNDGVALDEDSNEKDIETKGILRDTGLVAEDDNSSDSSDKASSCENDESTSDNAVKTEEPSPPDKIADSSKLATMKSEPANLSDQDQQVTFNEDLANCTSKMTPNNKTGLLDCASKIEGATDIPPILDSTKEESQNDKVSATYQSPVETNFISSGKSSRSELHEDVMDIKENDSKKVLPLCPENENMDATSSSVETPMQPVVEEVVTKTKTWVCGDLQQPIPEKLNDVGVVSRDQISVKLKPENKNTEMASVEKNEGGTNMNQTFEKQETPQQEGENVQTDKPDSVNVSSSSYKVNIEKDIPLNLPDAAYLSQEDESKKSSSETSKRNEILKINNRSSSQLEETANMDTEINSEATSVPNSSTPTVATDETPWISENSPKAQVERSVELSAVTDTDALSQTEVSSELNSCSQCENTVISKTEHMEIITSEDIEGSTAENIKSTVLPDTPNKTCSTLEAPEESLVTNDDKVLSEEPSITNDDEVLREESLSTNDDKVIPEETSPVKEKKVLTEETSSMTEEKVLTEEHSTSNDDKGVLENTSCTIKKKVRTEEISTIAENEAGETEKKLGEKDELPVECTASIIIVPADNSEESASASKVATSVPLTIDTGEEFSKPNSKEESTTTDSDLTSNTLVQKYRVTDNMKPESGQVLNSSNEELTSHNLSLENLTHVNATINNDNEKVFESEAKSVETLNFDKQDILKNDNQVEQTEAETTTSKEDDNVTDSRCDDITSQNNKSLENEVDDKPLPDGDSRLCSQVQSNENKSNILNSDGSKEHSPDHQIPTNENTNVQLPNNHEVANLTVSNETETCNKINNNQSDSARKDVVLSPEKGMGTMISELSETKEVSVVESKKGSELSSIANPRDEPSEVSASANVKNCLGLVSYDSSSEDDNDSNSDANNIDTTLKRKGEQLDEDDPPSKNPKLDLAEPPNNPIVGEAIEESVMVVKGEGSGAMCEGGNPELALENNQEEVLNSDLDTNEDSHDSVRPPAPKRRGRKPGPRKRKGRPPGSLNKPKPPGLTTPSPRGRKKKQFTELGIPLEALEVVNGGTESSTDRPVRASRRIAQIRLKEEEERRRLEEEQLAQLKEAQMRKQQRKEAKAESKNKMSKKLKEVNVYLPSESSSESAGSGDGDYELPLKHGKKKRKKKKRNKNGKPKVFGKPWAASSSSDEDSEAVDEEEEVHEEEETLVFIESDHEFSPESDLGDDDHAGPLRHARTAKRDEIDEEEETGCKKCGKGDHPEWILLCDKCDQGWHASCLRPQLWVIPEGEWFCPPCQHNMLVDKLGENLVEYDKLLKRRENEVLRKKRLAFVGINLDNVLPDSKPVENQENVIPSEELKFKKRKKDKIRRRRILSDEELSDNFIDDRSSDDMSGSGSSQSSNSDSEEEPIYRLRARRAPKKFDYKEYDDMIISACRASDEEIVDHNLQPETAIEPEPLDGVNGEPEVEEKHSGKTEAYEKHLKEMEEGEETDEELLDEKERNRRRELKKASGSKRKKRSLRDLDDFTDEDNSDEDFKGSEAEDEDDFDEDAIDEEDESEWSGDKDESDDSIAFQSRRAGKGKYGRKEKYIEVGAVRRSTRRRKARVSYDESDQDEDEDDGEEKWHSEETEEETPSESDDETYGKRKRKKVPPKSTTPRFFLGASIPPKKPAMPKKKRKKVDEDDVDRAWSSSHGSKVKKSVAEQKVERRTRGRKINFKDILDSGESDDDGNVRPKRRLSSDDDEVDEAESSRRLAEKIKAANQREAALYAAQLKAQQQSNQGTVSSEGKDVENVVLSTVSTDMKSSTQSDPLTSSLTADRTSDPKRENNSSIPVSTSSSELELALLKPVPAPPLPPSLIKARNKKGASGSPEKVSSKSVSKAIPTTVPVPSAAPSPAMSSVRMSTAPITSVPNSASLPATCVPTPPTTSSSSKKASKHGGTPEVTSNPMSLTQQPPNQSSPLPPPGVHPGIPLDISRVPNPSIFQGNPGARPFHPMWVRNHASYGNASGGPTTTSIGKPPPLNNPAFMTQHGSPRGYPNPPPLRIPNPSQSPLQAFQQFRREQPQGPGPGLYRLPPNQPQPGALPGILAAGLVPHQGSPERFFASPSPYSPYAMIPPHSQPHQPQALFGAPFDFRHGSETFKDDSPRGAPGAPSSSPPHSAASGPPTTIPVKEEAPQSESEFGGLVSYFSSQRTEDDDMDT